jgi:mitochondrial fission protein ELM1
VTAKGKLTIWQLIDDRAGNQSQCLGVGDALGLKCEVRDLEYTAAAALPNFVMGKTFGGLTASSRINLVEPWPDLIIAAGRRCSPVARHIKDMNKGNTFLVQIMYPGDTGIDEFDLVCTPRHDAIQDGPNIFQITGAPHRVTLDRLETARQDWLGRLMHLPAPRIALIVGGSTKRRTFTEQMARELGAAASKMAMDAGGSLMVTTSRRSNDSADALISEIKAPTEIFKWKDEGENPYLGFLAMAEGVIVTGDSVSMCSEAAATSGPVWIYAPKKLTIHKHGILHQQLIEDGYAKDFDVKGGVSFEEWRHPSLNAAIQISTEIKKRMKIN